ncbi:MAG: anti-sigma factor antagonist [Balneolaceae bacterium]|jgi:anti-sigma B factor antagonist|nr:MAG: anti-sigma factor antagonist [Balneolaceae bacterium]
MKFNISERYNCVVIELKGKIMGGPDADYFKAELQKLIDAGKTKLIIDLQDVKFMNSSGLGILIGGLTTMRKIGGDIKLANADKRISSLLMVSQLNTVFDHHLSLDSAIKAYDDE